jgi:hypothetical protein
MSQENVEVVRRMCAEFERGSEAEAGAALDSFLAAAVPPMEGVTRLPPMEGVTRLESIASHVPADGCR